jgi:hypothetical protein
MSLDCPRSQCAQFEAGSEGPGSPILSFCCYPIAFGRPLTFHDYMPIPFLDLFMSSFSERRSGNQARIPILPTTF